MDIEELMEGYKDLIPKYSHARANRTYLEEYKRSQLSILMKESEALGHKTSAAQEREAYCNPAYLTHLESLKAAVELDEFWRYKIRQYEMEIEIWRTNQANNRMERKAYGA